MDIIGENGTSFLDKLKKLPRERLIILGVVIAVVIVVIIAVAVVMKPPPPPEEPKEAEPVYEVDVGEIKFILKEAKDIGNILKVSESNNPEARMDDAVTTGRFIEVTVGATNIGKEDLRGGNWLINDLIDNEGRKFHTERKFDYWIPEESQCNTLLKPGFDPVFCIKIYDVAKISSGLKIEVETKARKGGTGFLDLGI